MKKIIVFLMVASSMGSLSGETLRLIYPQWQGADIAKQVPEVSNPNDAARGYYLGAKLLEFLAPSNPNQKTYTVPIDTVLVNREVIDGVLDREVLRKQTADAMWMLRRANPDKIVTLGGECSVSAAPFTYLANKYDGDVAIVWIDAHPDITLPKDSTYAGFHAMVLAVCMGQGEKKLLWEFPAKIAPSKVLFVGLRDWERDEIKVRQQELGIKHLTPEEVSKNSDAVVAWLKTCGASKVMVHFDLDVLDPAEIIAAVGVVPNGMKISEVVRVINDISRTKDLVALTIAEPMPRTAIRIKEMLEQLPLLQ